MLQLTNLTCCARKAPVGLDDPSPRFGWQLLADRKNTLQWAYQLQISADATFSDLFWDSGRTESDQSVHVPYGGPPLEATKRYHFRVRVWDNHGQTSGWAASFWETGLLTTDNWQARWITSGDPQEAELMASPLFRRAFSVEKSVVSARIYATALGLYELHLNGKRVGEKLFTPGWTSYQERLQYQTYDVTALLTTGENVLGAVLGNGWYAGYIAWQRGKAFYGDRRALLLQLHLRFSDGTEQILTTDESWQTDWSPIQMAELYHGEDYDARREQPGWTVSGFDAASWRQAAVYEHGKDMLVAQQGEPACIMEELVPLAKIVTPKGETVLDFGQNLVGFVRFTISGPRGTTVTLRHAEVLDQEGNFYTENLKGARETVNYTLKGGEAETFQPHFTYMGFRYVCLENWPEEVGLSNFTACAVYADLPVTGSFSCSDPLVNRLQENILWGQKGNFLEAPTDCPQRDERHGWTGDAQVFIRTACFNMDVSSFFEKWLADLAGDQKKLDGGVPFVVPNVRAPEESSSAAWGDAATICPWTLYLCYGDRRILEKQFESMKNWVEFVRRQGEDEFLWNTGFHFGDWLALDNGPGAWIGATATDLIATAFYANSARLTARAARVLEKEMDAAKYDDLYRNILAAFRRKFVTPGGQLTCRTQTAYILALMFDLLEEANRPQAADTLVQLLHESQDHLNTGFVGTPYLCHVLSRFGHNDLAYRLLLHRTPPSWLYPVTRGATTIWEHWDSIREDGSFWDKEMNSFNHYAYGSIGDWLYRVVAGLDVCEDGPGYRHCRIHPHPGEGLTFAEASYRSVYGEIRVRWERKDAEMRVSIVLPANVTASVTLPGAAVIGTTANGVALTEEELLSGPVQAGADVELVLGSGAYVFVYDHLSEPLRQ